MDTNLGIRNERNLLIANKEISDDSDCFFIAEIGHNHQGDVEKCKQLISKAHECGADAVKLQKRDNKSLFTRQMYNAPYDNRNSFGATYGEHRDFLEFGRQEYRELIEYCDQLGVIFFATAFDFNSADFLAQLDMPAYKIASGDLRSIPLLKHVASFNKPLIISTGGAAMEDIERAYDTLMPINDQICIMQCTSGYPPEYHELNLRVIDTYRKRFPNVVIGYSGHDNGIAMSLVAYMLGARIIEKHFTLNRAWKGTDHAFSLEPNGLRRLIRDLRRTKIALGDGRKVVYESEVNPIRKMSKKIVAKVKLKKGQKLSMDVLQFKSPGDGISPFEVDNILGKTLVSDIAEDDAIRYEDIV